MSWTKFVEHLIVTTAILWTTFQTKGVTDNADEETNDRRRCKPGDRAQIEIIENSLHSLQKVVGGDIQVLYPYDDPIAIICNEEGKINGMLLNRALRDSDGTVYDIIAGTFLIVGLDGENYANLSEEYLEEYRKQFLYPEVFIGMECKRQEKSRPVLEKN